MMGKIIIISFIFISIFMGFEKELHCTEGLKFERISGHEQFIIPKEVQEDKRPISLILYDMNRRFYDMVNSLQVLSIVLLVLEIIIIILLIKIRKENKQQHQNKKE